MAKKQSAIGLDIGSKTIKLVQLKRSNQGLSLENFATAELTPEAIYEGMIHDPQVVTETLQSLVSNLQIKSKQVALSIGGHSVIVKKITLPAMSDEELAESIHWEAGHYIPYDLVDVYLDYQILQVRSDQGQMDVMLVAAKRDIVNQYVDVVRQAGLKPVVVDTDCFAVQNSFELNYQLPEDDLICLIHIGAENLNINVLAYGVNTFTRDLQLGGDLYIREIQKQMGASQQEAEAYIRGGDGEGGAQIIPQEVQRILVTMSEYIASEVNRSLEFHLATSGESRFSRIYLSGGATRLTALADEIAKRTHTPVELLDPFKEIAIDTQVFEPQYLINNRAFASVALGLAIRHRHDKSKDLTRINLLPITEADRIEDGRNLFLIYFLLVLMISGGFVYLREQSREEERQQRAELSRRRREEDVLRERIKESQNLQGNFDSLKADVDR